MHAFSYISNPNLYFYLLYSETFANLPFQCIAKFLVIVIIVVIVIVVIVVVYVNAVAATATIHGDLLLLLLRSFG